MYIKRTIKCDYCQEEKVVGIRLTDYVYKRTLKRDCKKTVYFCGYNCMQRAYKENPERYVKKRDTQ